MVLAASLTHCRPVQSRTGQSEDQELQDRGEQSRGLRATGTGQDVGVEVVVVVGHWGSPSPHPPSSAAGSLPTEAGVSEEREL